RHLGDELRVRHRAGLGLLVAPGNDDHHEAHGDLDQTRTSGLNPPQNMRLPSKGSFFGSIMSARRLSLKTFFMTRSRWPRDLYTMYANTTVSPDLSLTLCGKEVCLPGFTSSATASRY